MTIEITDHIVNPANDQLRIVATDRPGAGGAYHRYEITGMDTSNPSVGPDDNPDVAVILFQNGPIFDVGVNGITHEALLAIVMHRLQCFQAGPFACKENSAALSHVASALDWLLERTRARMQRGVEGAHQS